MGRALALALTLTAMQARAEVVDPDTEAARRHYAQGISHYDAGRYRQALSEFEHARHLRSLPELDYDIARCHDRLEEWGDAAVAYERYLNAVPGAADADELRARVRVLRARLAQIAQPNAPPTSPPVVQPVSLPLAPLPQVAATVVAPAKIEAPRSRARLRAAAAASTAITVVALGAGAGLLGWVASDWPGLEASCRARPCGPADWADAERRTQAGWALIAIGAAGAVADIALFAIAFKRR
jgi:tetratricopeptide (TPR) repeat protein